MDVGPPESQKHLLFQKNLGLQSLFQSKPTVGHQFESCMVHNWAKNDPNEDLCIKNLDKRMFRSSFGFLGSSSDLPKVNQLLFIKDSN